MRFVMMVLGLALMAAAGLWFFTPVLDQTYARVAPQLTTSQTVASRSAAPASTSATRGAAPAAAPSATPSSSVATVNKALAENVMSMINLGTGILGALFTFMSYRLQVRDRQRRRGLDA